MTEAEKDVIRAAKDVTRTWKAVWQMECGYGDFRRVLVNAVDALLAERAQPLAAPPAQDVEALAEAELADAIEALYQVVWRLRAGKAGLTETGACQDRITAAREALAAARRPAGVEGK